MLGIFSRQSTNKQKSIPFQMELGEKFARKNGWKFIHYVEKGVSGGARIEDRKEFVRLIDDIEDGKINKVFLWEQDRAEREPLTWHTLCETLTESKAQLYENGELVDLEDEQTYIMRGLKSLMNRSERRKTVKKSKEKLHALVEKKGFIHGVMPYGYHVVNGKMVQHKEEAKTVKKIFQWSLEGNGYAEISNKLNADNTPTRYNKYAKTNKENAKTYKVDINRNNDLPEHLVIRDKSKTKWVHGTIKNILHNETYTGIRRFGDMIFEIEPIISKGDFEDVLERIKLRANKTGKKTFKEYLLNDMVWCSKCGRRYTGREVNKHTYYRCVSRIRKGESCGNKGIRKDILDKIIVHGFTPDEINNSVKKYITNGDIGKQRTRLINQVKQEKNALKVLEQKRERNLEGYNDLTVPKDLFLKFEKKYQEQIKAHERKLRSLETELSKIKDETQLVDDLQKDFDFVFGQTFKGNDKEGISKAIELAKKLEKVITPKMNHDSQQTLIKKYIDIIEVLFHYNIYKVQVNFKLPIPSATYYIDKDYYNYVKKGNTKGVDLKHPLTHNREKKLEQLLRQIRLIESKT